ncbi:hypothetical protein Taro_031399, partial [Colocasia esculenta]|nr:hypothetical protein [Colocasia esculenta]
TAPSPYLRHAGTDPLNRARRPPYQQKAEKFPSLVWLRAPWRSTCVVAVHSFARGRASLPSVCTERPGRRSRRMPSAAHEGPSKDPPQNAPVLPPCALALSFGPSDLPRGKGSSSELGIASTLSWPGLLQRRDGGECK